MGFGVVGRMCFPLGFLARAFTAGLEFLLDIATVAITVLYSAYLRSVLRSGLPLLVLERLPDPLGIGLCGSQI
jgi:hypothetical protein